MTIGRSEMSSNIEDELRSVFEVGSDFVQPPPALADRARRAARRRRRRITAAPAAVAACALIATGGALIALPHRPVPPFTDNQLLGRVVLTYTHGEEPVALLADGKYLYSETAVYTKSGNQVGPMTLAAYSRLTGKLVGETTIPNGHLGTPMLGPGSSVWMATGSLTSDGPVRLWLYSPDLRLRTKGPPVQSTFMLPVSATTALVPVARGLLQVHMKPPGEIGYTEHLESGTSLGRGISVMGTGWAVELDGRVAVDLPDSSNYDYHVEIAGQPSIRYGDQNIPQAAAVAGNSLWFAEGYRSPLVELNGDLQPTTPGFVTADPVLKKVVDVFSAGGTIWVTTLNARHPLVCFATDSQDGPVVTLPLHGFVMDLAAEGRTVYIESSRTQLGNPRTITSYPVPAACR